MAHSREFDGKIYTSRFGYRRKAVAQRVARKIRKGGKWLVRVVREGKQWNLYHRRRR